MHHDSGPKVPEQFASWVGSSVARNGETDPALTDSATRKPAGRFCVECGHPKTRHELAVEEDVRGQPWRGRVRLLPGDRPAGRVGGRLRVPGTHGDLRGRPWSPVADRATGDRDDPVAGSAVDDGAAPVSEVTTTDPVTGQPDFETIEINYVPDRRLIDTKSLKKYWSWWRGQGASMERLSALVARMSPLRPARSASRSWYRKPPAVASPSSRRPGSSARSDHPAREGKPLGLHGSAGWQSDDPDDVERILNRLDAHPADGARDQRCVVVQECPGAFLAGSLSRYGGAQIRPAR